MDRNWEEDWDYINKYSSRDGQEDTIQGIAHHWMVECQKSKAEANGLRYIINDPGPWGHSITNQEYRKFVAQTAAMQEVFERAIAYLTSHTIADTFAGVREQILADAEKALKAHQLARFEAFLKENAGEMEGKADEN